MRRRLLAVCLANVCLGFGLLAASDKPPVSDDNLAAWVDARVAERQPPPEDKRFDEIGWVADIRTAERLAKEHQRPVFLFTHDGRMNLGRC
jgi:hypothetical protein